MMRSWVADDRWPGCKVPFVLLTPATAEALGAAGYVPSVPTVPLDECTFPSARAAAVRSSILAHSAAIQQATRGELG
jgi:hypothetical protein